MTKNKNVIYAADLFCGAGGTSSGLVTAIDALGYDLELFAVNHCSVAIDTHSTNHKRAKHFCQTLDTLDPKKVVLGGRLHLLVASPECFPAGTLVLTEKGYEPIEEIPVGRLVLTHRNRWRRVTHIMSSPKSTIIIKGQGHPGLETTAEHPFYSRIRKQRHRPIDGNYHKFEEPKWVNAEELQPAKHKRYWATPRIVESLPVPTVGGRGFYMSLDFWWLVGFWLAEGVVRIRKTSSEITLCCGNHEADEIEKRLEVFKPIEIRAGYSELRWRRRKVRTATLFETAHEGLANWLVNNFGKTAKKKRIPSWVFGMPEKDRRALLNGYLQGDGSLERGESSSPKQTCQTVSFALAYGIKTLVSTLGYRASVHSRKPSKDTIEGRKVNISPALGVHWTVEPQRNESFDDGTHTWTKVKDVIPGRFSVQTFNLSVEEDESYVVEGVVVHNCIHHSNARGGKPMSEQSRASAWLILNWLEKLYVDCVLIENVKEFRSWGALGVNGRPLKSQRGKLYQQFLENLRALGYKVEDRVLNAADYGDATSRERLFIMARRDKKPIVFPTPTHAKKPYTTIKGQTLSKWRPAREIIDWSLEGESIFTRKRPLAENTLKRIFAGLKKFCGLDFILPNKGHYRGVGALIQPYVVVLRNNVNHRAIDDPLPTITTLGSIMGLAQPYLVSFRKNTDGQDVDAPISTLTTKEHCGLAEPYLIALEHMSGEHNSRCKTINEPMQTICGKGSFGLISPYLIEFHGGKDSEKRVRDLSTPLPTADTSNRFGLAQPFLIQFFGERNGQEPRTRSVEKPLWTVTAQGRMALAQPELNSSNAMLLDSNGETIGEIIGKLDIKFRMLQPHELAAAMGFPKSYKFAGNRAEQVRQIGNAVPCNLASALCRTLIERKGGSKKEKAA